VKKLVFTTILTAKRWLRDQKRKRAKGKFKLTLFPSFLFYPLSRKDQKRKRAKEKFKLTLFPSFLFYALSHKNQTP